MMRNELIAAVEAMDPTVLGNALLATTAIAAFAALWGLIRYLLTAIGYSKMYRKAGEAPWKAFVPFYNTYSNYKLSWNSKRFFQYAALYVLFAVMSHSSMLSVQLAGLLAGILLIAVTVRQHVNMAKRFGKGTGNGIALMFFPGITSLILGLGKAEFQAELAAAN